MYTPAQAEELLKMVSATTRLKQETVVRVLLVDILCVLKEAELDKAEKKTLHTIAPFKDKEHYLRAIEVRYPQVCVVICWLRMVEPKEIEPYKNFFAYKDDFLGGKE
jgi:hypothetical protein